jgi:hypothetical protein
LASAANLATITESAPTGIVADEVDDEELEL